MPTYDEIRERLAEANPGAILFDGYEEALIGYVERFSASGHILVALYDRDACIRLLVDRDGMSWEEAEEFFSFNTEGCYAGPHTPAFATIMRPPWTPSSPSTSGSTAPNRPPS